MKKYFFTFCLLLVGCGGLSGQLIKTPISNQCNQIGLSSCPELTDGIIEYVVGDPDVGLSKVRAAASNNSPDKLKKFSEAISVVANNIGGGTGTTLKKIVSVLYPDGPKETLVKSQDNGLSKEITSKSEFSFNTGTERPAISFESESCDPFDKASKFCRRVRILNGPYVITNAYVPSNCKDQIFIAAGNDHRWFLMASENSGMNISGNFQIRHNEPLYIGFISSSDSQKDMHCSLTWSGHK